MNLDDLNPAQHAAVTAPDGPILILAGAGSGKTRVLTYRIAWLLAQHKAAAREMLAVTFTNKAAAEMRERVGLLIGAQSQWPWISTFHSACARILRIEAPNAGFTRDFTIFDEGDALSILRRIIEEAALPDSPSAEIARARIDQAKNEGLAPESLAEEGPGGEALAHIYRLYQKRLRAMNAMDFGDLQLFTYELFMRSPEALARWQARAVQLLVDEYQDTNRVQYLLVRALSAHSGNLCVVGDEDQSIYRWRGANIRNILDFENDFRHARIFKLEQNYRSTGTILAAAGDVIRNNSERKEKNLWTENDAGEPLTYFTGISERDEADFIAREIARLTGGAMRAADIVVFYRVNAQSRVIEEALVRRRIPYYVVGGVRFYEHREIKDLLAYLRVLANPADAVSFERAVNIPPRGLGARTLEAIREVANAEGKTMFEALGRMEATSKVALRFAKQASALYEWLTDLGRRAASMNIRAALDEIVTHTGFVAYLDVLDDGATRRQNLAEMLAAASAFDAELPAATGRLTDFLERVALVSAADDVGEGGRVALMTLHTSKGLEYDAVFIAGMEEGLFPHNRSRESGAEIEEERRLCYVGMTRARRLLYLTNTLSRELYGSRAESRPSRFIGEISSELMRRIAPEERTPTLRPPSREPYVDYSDSQIVEDDSTDGFGPGASVIHPTFGHGVIRRREGRGDAAKAWVNFERAGLKLLVLKFANLRPGD